MTAGAPDDARACSSGVTRKLTGPGGTVVAPTGVAGGAPCAPQRILFPTHVSPFSRPLPIMIESPSCPAHEIVVIHRAADGDRTNQHCG